jgi:hypothetical protein
MADNDNENELDAQLREAVEKLPVRIVPAPFGRGADSQLEKRQYLPFVVTATCPQCKHPVVRDLRADYMSYPLVGYAEPLHFGHAIDGEWHEWSVTVVIGFTLEVAPDRTENA